MTKRAIGIAGAGRVGSALGKLLYDVGLPVVAIASRGLEHAAAAADFIGAGVRPVRYEELPAWCSRVVIAVPDDAVRSVACLLAQSGFTRGLALHTSGVHGREVLDCLDAEGASCAALHPLQTVPNREKGVVALRGCYFALSGDGEAADWARSLVLSLNGTIVELADEARPLYHAAAVVSCNYVVMLVEAGFRMLGKVGIDRSLAAGGFGPLIHETVANLLEMKGAEALTGPVMRGDVGTVQRHLLALEQAGLGDLEQLYRTLGLHAVRRAREAGLKEEAATALEVALTRP